MYCEIAWDLKKKLDIELSHALFPLPNSSC